MFKVRRLIIIQYLIELARTAAVDEAVGVVSDDEEIGEFEFDDV